MIPILRSSSAFLALYSSTSLITAPSASTSAWAIEISSCWSAIFCFRLHQNQPEASAPITRPTRIRYCPMSLPSSSEAAGLALRTARLPSLKRLILIMGLLPHLADAEPDRHRHHRPDRLQPVGVEVALLVMDPLERVHQLGGHLEALAQHLEQVRGEGAAAGEHQLVDRTLRGGRREEVEGLAD